MKSDPMKPAISRLSSPQATADGFIVVAVLWILGLLGALVSIYVAFVINSAAALPMHDERLRAEALVSAAIELAAYRHLSAPAQATPAQPAPTSGRFGFRLGNEDVAVEYESEAARIDLNAAPKQLLVGLFLVLGARQQDAEIYGDRIVAWRTRPTGGQDTEASAYRAARLGYGPRGGKFPHPGELLLVRDLPVALVERALPFVTVYSGRPQVNILDAAPEVIAALPGINPQRLNEILAKRRVVPVNGTALLPLLGAAQQYASTEAGRALRIAVRIRFDSGRQTSSEVIILTFDQADTPFAVLSWRDELEANRANGARRGSQ
jgi:general secretion pathway protein K